MKTTPSIFAVLAVGLAALGTMLADDEKPQGRTCISIVAPGAPEHEVVFSPNALRGPGMKIKIYADASVKSGVIAVAFRKDGKLAEGWRPEITELPEDFEEVHLPKPPAVWECSSQGAPFDLYIVFLSFGVKDLEELKKLISAMQNPKVDERLLVMQTSKLRELINRITAAAEKENRVVVINPEVGGVFRGPAFPWRQFAKKVDFSPAQPGVLVFSSPEAESSKAAPAASQ